MHNVLDVREREKERLSPIPTLCVCDPQLDLRPLPVSHHYLSDTHSDRPSGDSHISHCHGMEINGVVIKQNKRICAVYLFFTVLLLQAAQKGRLFYS